MIVTIYDLQRNWGHYKYSRNRSPDVSMTNKYRPYQGYRIVVYELHCTSYRFTNG
jgi:hypothetical protein